MAAISALTGHSTAGCFDNLYPPAVTSRPTHSPLSFPAPNIQPLPKFQTSADDDDAEAWFITQSVCCMVKESPWTIGLWQSFLIWQGRHGTLSIICLQTSPISLEKSRKPSSLVPISTQITDYNQSFSLETVSDETVVELFHGLQDLFQKWMAHSISARLQPTLESGVDKMIKQQLI